MAGFVYCCGVFLRVQGNMAGSSLVDGWKLPRQIGCTVASDANLELSLQIISSSPMNGMLEHHGNVARRAGSGYLKDARDVDQIWSPEQ